MQPDGTSCLLAALPFANNSRITAYSSLTSLGDRRRIVKGKDCRQSSTELKEILRAGSQAQHGQHDLSFLQQNRCFESALAS
jgi:hypothetical protein